MRIRDKLGRRERCSLYRLDTLLPEMPLRRILFGAIAVIALMLLAGFAWTWRPAIAPIAGAERPSVDEPTFRHGAELAAIGNCNDCHVGDSGKPYAGGRAIPTPFGKIFASNITPDAETGIGNWSEEAFHRAMHEGVDREGRQLYPAFPYDHFTKATNDDIHALYAFLISQPPVHNAIPANQLAFPFNFRPIDRRVESSVPARDAAPQRRQQKRRMESRAISGRRPRALRVLPHAAQYAWCGKAKQRLRRRRRRRLGGAAR